MASIVEDVLETWREAERLLDELPPLHPDHETVRRISMKLRSLYQAMTRASDASHLALRESAKTIDDARAVLAAAATRRRREAAAEPSGDVTR